MGDILSHDFGRCDAEQVAWFTRYGTFDHHDIEFTVDLDNLELSDLRLGAPHSPGHFLARVDTSWSSSGTNGAELPMALGPVSHKPSLEIVSLDST